MAFFKKQNPGARNRWKRNVSEALKRQALDRQCPECKRKSALKRIEIWPGHSFRICRFCQAEITSRKF